MNYQFSLTSLFSETWLMFTTWIFISVKDVTSINKSNWSLFWIKTILFNQCLCFISTIYGLQTNFNILVFLFHNVIVGSWVTTLECFLRWLCLCNFIWCHHVKHSTYIPLFTSIRICTHVHPLYFMLSPQPIWPTCPRFLIKHAWNYA